MFPRSILGESMIPITWLFSSLYKVVLIYRISPKLCLSSKIWHNMPQVKFICSLSYERNHFEVSNYLFKFYKMFDSIPIYIFSNDISMFFSQVKQNCWSIWSVVVIADQAVVNNAFMFCKVPIKLIFRPEKGSSRLSCF